MHRKEKQRQQYKAAYMNVQVREGDRWVEMICMWGRGGTSKYEWKTAERVAKKKRKSYCDRIMFMKTVKLNV